jgi:hypothetical protein
MKIVIAEDPDLPRGPACKLCGRATRLVGIEPHPTIASVDLRTFLCAICEESQTQNVPLEASVQLPPTDQSTPCKH